MKIKKSLKKAQQKKTHYSHKIVDRNRLVSRYNKKGTQNLQRTKTKVAYPGAPLNSGSPQ